MKKGSVPALSRRQTDIMELLVVGSTNKQIAEKLGVNIETVKTHLKHIGQKYQSSNRTEMAIMGMNFGFGQNNNKKPPKKPADTPESRRVLAFLNLLGIKWDGVSKDTPSKLNQKSFLREYKRYLRAELKMSLAQATENVSAVENLLKYLRVAIKKTEKAIPSAKRDKKSKKEQEKTPKARSSKKAVKTSRSSRATKKEEKETAGTRRPRSSKKVVKETASTRRPRSSKKVVKETATTRRPRSSKKTKKK